MDEPLAQDTPASIPTPSGQPGPGRFALVVAALLTALPILHIAVYLLGYLVNVPWWDEYDVSMVIAEKTVTHSLTLRDLFMSQNEHVIFFTNLITAISAQLGRWYVPAGSWVSFGLTVLNLLLLFDLFRRDCPAAAPAAAPIFAALIFSIRQVFNWQLAFQNQWFFVVLWLLLGLWVLRVRRVGWKALVAASVMAILATFSFSLGLLLWLVLAFAAWLLGYRRLRYLVYWVLVGAATAAVWSSIHGSSGLPPTTDPGLLARYVLIVLGSPLVWGNTVIAILLTCLVTGVFAANLVYLWPRTSLERLAIWIALAMFAAAAAAATAVGRGYFLTFDPIQPMEGRYVSTSVLLWIAAIALALMVLARVMSGQALAGRVRFLSRANVIFLGIIAGAHLIVTIYFYQYPALAPSLVPHWQAECMKTYPETLDDACIRGDYPSLEGGRVRVLELAKYHLALFADRP